MKNWRISERRWKEWKWCNDDSSTYFFYWINILVEIFSSCLINCNVYTHHHAYICRVHTFHLDYKINDTISIKLFVIEKKISNWRRWRMCYDWIVWQGERNDSLGCWWGNNHTEKKIYTKKLCLQNHTWIFMVSHSCFVFLHFFIFTITTSQHSFSVNPRSPGAAEPRMMSNGLNGVVYFSIHLGEEIG